jgi:fumarate reductase subunit C
MFARQWVLDFQWYQKFLLPEVQNLLVETWLTGSLVFVIVAIGRKPGQDSISFGKILYEQ